MLNQWEIYRLMSISGLIITACIVFFIFPNLVRKKKPVAEISSSTTSSNEVSQLGKQINPRFFLAVNFSLIFMGMFLILLPCVGILRHAGPLLCTLFITGLAALGLFYSTRKGDLGWLATVTRGKK